MKTHSIRLTAFVLSAAALATAPVQAADYSVDASGNWTTAGTWSPSGPPAAADSIVQTSIAGNRTVSLDGAANTTYSVTAINTSYGTSSLLLFQGLVGSGNKTLNVTGDITQNSAGTMAFASGSSANLTLNVSGKLDVLAGTFGVGSGGSLLSTLNVAGLTTVESGAVISVRGNSRPSFNGGLDLKTGATLTHNDPTTSFPRDTFGGLRGGGTISVTNTTATDRINLIQLTGDSGDWNFTGDINTTTTSTGSLITQLTRRGTNGVQYLGGTIGNHSGTTTISGGVLAFTGSSTLTSSNIVIDTAAGRDLAVLGLGNGDLSRSLGTGAGQISLNGANAGFAAYGGTRTVTLGDEAIIWGGAGFTVTDLVLGHTSSDATIVLANDINLNGAARTVSVGNGSAQVDARLSGVLSAGGGGSLVKDGDGALELTAANTMASVTVSAGALVVNNTSGSGTGPGVLTVASGATLGGSGIIGGATTISGSLRPGNSIGTLTVANDVTWNSGDNWVFELGAAGPTLAAPGTSDFLAITEAGSDFLQGTGSTWTFDFAGTATTEGWYKLVEWAGTTDFASTDFVGINLGGNFNSEFSIQDNALYLNVVPEPSTYAMLALAGAGFAAHIVRRRRRRQL